MSKTGKGFWSRLFSRPASVGAAPVGRQRISRGARNAYDGATKGKRAGGWRRSGKDANAELSPAVQAALRGIARDLVRNNPYAARGIAVIAEYLVGDGITFQVYRDGKVDDVLNKLAREHFDKTNCDALGRHDLYGLQLQAARSIVESGAVLMRRRWRRASDGLPLPFQLQILEPDYLDAGRNGPLGGTVDGGYTLDGIEYSPIGRREGYWLFNGHPGSAKIVRSGSTFVQAKDIAHVFRADRPEQEHGATWFAPIILRLKDFGDYEDAQLVRQKISAAFAGFVHGDPDGEPISGKDDAGESTHESLDYVEPGTISYLSDGQTITFPSPPTVDGYIDYSLVTHRAIAAGLGVPYENLTGDLSKVSYISGRLGRLSFLRSVATWQWTMFIPQFCGSVERWFLDAAALMGHDVRGVSLRWTPPRVPLLDPASEVPAIRDAIRSGQDTISNAARERGQDPDTFLDEWAADAAALDARGLIFDSDPRKVTAVGNPTFPPTRAEREGKTE
ncbi:MAG: phage portal protein [Sphingobium sp.]|nr:phage portal protein [Sphingobium sp.]